MNKHVLALLFVTLVWGATFPVLKLATAHLNGIEISALRFAIAAICMLPWALRAPRRTWMDGALLGALVLLSYVAQAVGLEFISSNRSAFLTSLNVLMVPLLGLAFGNRLSWKMLAAAVMACTGIGLIVDGGSHLLADLRPYWCWLTLPMSFFSRSAQRGTLRVDWRQRGCLDGLTGHHLDGGCSMEPTVWLLTARVDTTCLLACCTWVLWPRRACCSCRPWRNAMYRRTRRHWSTMEPVFAALAAWLWGNC